MTIKNLIFQTKARFLNIQLVYFIVMNGLLFSGVYNSEASFLFKVLSPLFWNLALIYLIARTAYYFQLFQGKLVIRNYLLFWFHRELLIEKIHLVQKNHAIYLGSFLDIQYQNQRLVFGCDMTQGQQIEELIAKLRAHRS